VHFDVVRFFVSVFLFTCKGLTSTQLCADTVETTAKDAAMKDFMMYGKKRDWQEFWRDELF